MTRTKQQTARKKTGPHHIDPRIAQKQVKVNLSSSSSESTQPSSRDNNERPQTDRKSTGIHMNHRIGEQSPKTADKHARLQTARKSTGGLNNSRNEAESRKITDKNGVRKYRPGVVALKEIRHYQRSTELVIKHAPFQRLVREIVAQFKLHDLRIQANAMFCLQVI